jgi:hypothetical protein
MRRYRLLWHTCCATCGLLRGRHTRRSAREQVPHPSPVTAVAPQCRSVAVSALSGPRRAARPRGSFWTGRRHRTLPLVRLHRPTTRRSRGDGRPVDAGRWVVPRGVTDQHADVVAGPAECTDQMAPDEPVAPVTGTCIQPHGPVVGYTVGSAARRSQNALSQRCSATSTPTWSLTISTAVSA